MARALMIDIHTMTIKDLPSFEMYEEGSQIRRSVKSVKSNIVEGYGRHKYQQDYIRFITYSLSSNDETIDHLENIFETGSLKKKELYDDLHSRLVTLGKKLNLFLQALNRKSAKKTSTSYSSTPKTIKGQT
jgi:four helix bundle protein